MRSRLDSDSGEVPWPASRRPSKRALTLSGDGKPRRTNAGQVSTRARESNRIARTPKPQEDGRTVSDAGRRGQTAPRAIPEGPGARPAGAGDASGSRRTRAVAEAARLATMAAVNDGGGAEREPRADAVPRGFARDPPPARAQQSSPRALTLDGLEDTAISPAGLHRPLFQRCVGRGRRILAVAIPLLAARFAPPIGQRVDFLRRR